MHSLLRPNHTPPLHDGHYVLTLDDLQLPSHLQIFLQANMNSTFFPTKTQYFQLFQQQLHSMVTTPWSTHRPLPTQLTFSTPTMETTHRQHSTYTAIHITQCHPITAVPYRQTGVASRRSRIAESTAFLPTTLFPRMSHYLEHTTTFSTTTQISQTNNFTSCSLNLSPPTYDEPTHGDSANNSTHHMRSSLPQTKEVMAKRKNSHQLLPIYSRHHCYEPPPKHWTSCFFIFYLNIQANSPSPTYGSTFTTTSKTTPEDIHLTPINDDLVGFFNSVPQQRLVDAVISLCNRWKAQHTLLPPSPLTYNPPAIPSNTPTSVDTTFTTHNNAHSTLNTSPLIVQQALQSCIFQACNTYYKQIQGAGIGSQLSPALCNVAITLIEHTWQTTYHTFLQQPSLHLLNTRYVDNRYILLNEQYRSALPITTLAHPDFYEHPVEIEPVDDDHLLGFLIDPTQQNSHLSTPHTSLADS